VSNPFNSLIKKSHTSLGWGCCIQLWQQATTQSEKDRLHSFANETRDLFRAKTPYVYAQDKITQTLLQNATAARGASKLFTDFGLILYRSESATQAAKYLWFARMVGPNGDWDLKEKTQWQVPYDTFKGEGMTGTT